MIPNNKIPKRLNMSTAASLNKPFQLTNIFIRVYSVVLTMRAVCPHLAVHLYSPLFLYFLKLLHR